MGEEETQNLGEAQQNQEAVAEESGKALSQMNKDELKEYAEKLQGQLNQAYEDFDHERQELQEVIDDLEKRVESYKSALGSTANGQKRVVLEHEGTTYEVLTPVFKLDGEEHRAEELEEDSELMKTLLDKGFGGLRRL